MIVVQLNGGLGNQLFQYAFGKALATKNNKHLFLDQRLLTNPSRSYRLDNFQIQEDIAGQNHIRKFGFEVDFFGKRFFKNPFTVGQYGVYYEESNIFNEAVTRIENNAYLVGYWQSFKYFENVQDMIQTNLTLRNGESASFRNLSDQITATNSVSLHIRRGDYLSKQALDFHGILPVSYYSDGIMQISKAAGSDLTLYVFSDDPAWCKSTLNFPGYKTVFSGGAFEDYEDLLLMSKCKHNIIANSSFSWWAGWLNSNTNKIVVRPKQWYKHQNHEIKWMFPANWIDL